MITKELINTELGAILASLGKPVCNAAMWQEELGENAPSEAEILAKKAELDAAKAAQAAVLATGFDTGLGFSFAVGERDAQLLSVLYVGCLAEGAADDSLQDVWDVTGAHHSITWGQLKTVMAPYSQYCKALYKASKGL